MLWLMPKRSDAEYPVHIVKSVTTLQEALYATANDEPNQRDEQYEQWLPATFNVTREHLFGGSYLLTGFVFYAGEEESDDAKWRIVWAPFYPENFVVQLVTGKTTRKVWDWSLLWGFIPAYTRKDAEFYLYETVERWDNFDRDSWDAIQEAVDSAVDAYHEWKSARLARGSA